MPLLKGTYNMHLYPNAIGNARLVKTQLENSNCEKPGGVSMAPPGEFGMTSADLCIN